MHGNLPSRLVGIGLGLLLAACTTPHDDWQVSRGDDYPTERVGELQKNLSTAGQVISLLGVPYGRRTDSFIYSVQYTRPVERNFLLYSRPYTEQVTHRTFIGFEEGIVTAVEDKEEAQFLPAGPRR